MRKVLLSIVGTVAAVIVMLSCIVMFSCNDKYNNPVDPKGGKGDDTTATDTTGKDTTGGTDTTVTDTTVDFERPVLRREEPRAETFYTETIKWEYGVEITDSSIWISNPQNTIDTLLFFNFTATVINMAADKAASFYWYLNDSDTPDYTTADGKLELDWLYHGKIKVMCVDSEGVASLPDSFMVFPKYPPRPIVRVMKYEGDLFQYNWIRVDWLYEKCKKEEIERHLDFYGDSVDLFQANDYNRCFSYPKYYSNYIYYAEVDNEEKVSYNEYSIYWYTSYFSFVVYKFPCDYVGVGLVNVKGYMASTAEYFYWY